MKKQELIEAISTTIVPNDEKGITAESLANLLIEIVESSENSSGGNNSGSGFLRVHLPIIDIIFMIAELTGEFRLDLDSWYAYIDAMASMNPVYEELLSPYTVIIEEILRKNAETYAQIKEAGKIGEGIMVLLDQSFFNKAIYEAAIEEEGLSAELEISISQPASVSYMEVTVEGETEESIFAIIPIKSNMDPDIATWIPYYMSVKLMSDGGLILNPESGCLTMPICEYEMIPLEIGANNKTMSAINLQTMSLGEIVAVVQMDGETRIVNLLSCESSYDSLTATFFLDGDYYKFTWNSDGTYSHTILE